MVNTEMMALNARADAVQFWPEMYFYDRAAIVLTRLLNIDARVRFCPSDERRYLRANHWLDQRCLAFFNECAKGLGIECGAGLSTRFHRLSEQHEWPQFSWIDIDSEERIALKSKAMPVIDNYRLITSDHRVEELVSAIGWDKSTPLMVAIDGLSHSVDIEWLKSLIQILLTLRYANTPISLFVVLEASPGWYEKILSRIGLPILGRWQSVFADLGGDVYCIKYFGKNTQRKKEMVIGLALRF
jgi:O-methyltransferase involved in polyketide biosynthesis